MAGHGLARIGSMMCLLLGGALAAGQSSELVHRHVSSEKLEIILKELDISARKSAGKKDGIFTYEFELKGTKVRLHNYKGDDLWIESDFTEKATLEDVNRWNMRAKFSRAVLVQDSALATVSLESQIDCTLGITDGMMRQFVRRFEGETESFVKFLKK
jgi:hypothetical protein